MTIVLTIAGSDPSGGAGIQADLRTIAALGATGVSAITALTAQNTEGVAAVYPVAADALSRQFDVLLADIRPDAVKIGMLGSADQVRAVAAAITTYDLQNVVLDPVLASTGGVPLLDAAGIDVLRRQLMPLCTVITPNCGEAGRLTGLPATDLSGMQAAARRLVDFGAKAVAVTGGHLAGDPTELLWHPDLPTPLLIPGIRIETPHTHGTGCLFSSALACGIAYGLALEDAVRKAQSAVQRALQTPVVIGRGRGYPGGLRDLSPARSSLPLPQQAALRGEGVSKDRSHREDHAGSPPRPSPKERESDLGNVFENVSISHLKPLSSGEGLGRGALKHRTNPFPLGEGGDAVAAGGEVSLYLVTDPDLRPDRTHEEVAKAALEGGARIIQLRDKHAPARELIAVGRRLRALCHEYGALFIVNDRVDIALATHADGVHLGPDDMSPGDARAMLGQDKIFGVSVSSIEEAEPLAPFADYLGVGAIFGSTTKLDAGDAVGVDRIREIKTAFPHLPLVAIGGINAANIARVFAAGADSAAVVSAVICADDMTDATRKLMRAAGISREK